MSFEIAKTPTLQAVATEDEAKLTAELQAKAQEVIHVARQRVDVTVANEAHTAARDRLNRLRNAERWLSQYAKDVDARISAQREEAFDELIETAGAGQKPEFKPLNELAAWETRARLVSRAIERLVERLLPAAELTTLREEAHWMMAQSRAIERIAQERAEKLLEQMREAVNEEMVLPVDMSKGVSGALLGHAAGLRDRAIHISENADRIEKLHGLSR